MNKPRLAPDPFLFQSTHDQLATIVKNRMSVVLYEYTIDKSIVYEDKTKTRETYEQFAREAIGRTLGDMAEDMIKSPEPIYPEIERHRMVLRVLLPKDVEDLVKELEHYIEGKKLSWSGL